MADTTMPWGPAVAKEFYDTLYDYGPSAEILKAYPREVRERELVNWYEQLVSGQPGEAFWKDQWVVGLIHIIVQVPNVFMLGMASRVEMLFLNQCLASFEHDKALEIYRAFKRVMDTVKIVIAEGYTHGLLEGMDQVGVNPKVMNRMRGMVVRKMISEAKGVAKWETSATIEQPG